MKFVKGKDTSIELIFRKALWKKGIRYRKNYNKLIGKPDLAITKYKIAIFCDGDFWHGKNINNIRVHHNKDYWQTKIQKNMQRDQFVNNELLLQGWYVLRFWETDIRKNLESCINRVLELIWDIEMNVY